MTVAGEDSVENHAPPAQVDPLDRHPPATPPERPTRQPERPATEGVCPYLLAASGGWRSASPHRDHRCTAIEPAAALSVEKQRRLCLVSAHLSCPTYVAARTARAAALAPGVDPAVLAAVEASRRPIARSAPLILEQPRLISPRASWPLDRAVSQAALVGLMVVAFALVAIARLSAGSGAAGEASPSPAASVAVVSGTPSPTPSQQEPSPSPGGNAASPSAPPTQAPVARTTYTVRSGDTLLGIAKKFGTTVTAIKKLNHLSSATIHVGQKLKIP